METEKTKWLKINTKIPTSHKIVEFLRESGPKLPKEIFNELNINETTGYAAIKRLTSCGLIRQFSDSHKYIHKDFVDKDAKIYDMTNRIMKIIEDKMFKDGKYPHSVLRLGIFRFAAPRLGYTYDDTDYKKAMILVGERLGVPWFPGEKPLIE